MGVLLNNLQGMLDDAKKRKWQRQYYAYTTNVGSMLQGVIQATLESDRTPKQKNIHIMETLVEAEMVKDVLFDNIHEGTKGYSQSYICGMGYEA